MIAIIDYKAGNLTSVQLAFDALNAPAAVTNRPDAILAANRVVFPGVGAARSAMRSLRDLELLDVIRTVVEKGTPFLGICLGAQIILDGSEEDGGTDTIGLVPGNVRLFDPVNPYDKVPQMGWNSVSQVRSHPIFEGIEDNSEFYFVHSYYPAPSEAEWILGKTDYAGVSFASAFGKNNLIATQFHPEKSGRIGLTMLKNFASWNP